MKLRPSPPAKRARVEIIPLIDVIFFLLATFVLVSLSMTRLQGLKLEMPASTTSSAPQEETEIHKIAIMRGNLFAWDKQTVTWDQLLTKLKQYRRESPDPRVLIHGEAEADFGPAVEILDYAYEIGISKISIQTQIKPIQLED